MNPAQLHLLFNHFPIVGLIIGVLVLAVGFFMKGEIVIKTALCIILGASLFAIPAFATGEGAEEIVEAISDVSHDIIHHHEEEGEQFFYLTIVMALLSLSALLVSNFRPKLYRGLKIAVLAVGIFTALMGMRAGHSGGEIRHPEVRSDFVAPEHDHHDEHEAH